MMTIFIVVWKSTFGNYLKLKNKVQVARFEAWHCGFPINDTTILQGLCSAERE